MISSVAPLLLAWLLTYLLHSTLLLGGAWLVLRTGRLAPSAADVIWKAALVGGILTAGTQVALGRAPFGSLALAGATAPQATATGPGFERDLTAPEARTEAVGARPSHTVGSGLEDARPGTPASLPARAAKAPSGAAGPIVLGWLLVVTALLLWFVGRRLVLVGRLGDRRPVPDEGLPDLLEALRAEFGVRRRVYLSTSASISSPVALGDDEICLPAAALRELDATQQRAMLAHELAHIERRDPQWLVFVGVVERVFFFQPLNRVARRGLQEAAEYLADDRAARYSGGVPLARALVKVAEWIQAAPLEVPVAGFAEERSRLTVRVARLLNGSPRMQPRSARAVLAFAVAIIGLTTAFAPGVARAPGAAGPSGPPQAGAGPEANAASLTLPPPATDTAIVRAVMARLKDEVAEVRRAAADALGRLGHPMAIDALVEALDDVDAEVRRAALHALSDFEPGRVPAAPIRRLLESDDPEVRGTAVQILGEIRDRGSIPAVAKLLADANAEVRYAALRAMEEMKAPLGDDLLARLLEDPDGEVRQAAAGLAGERQRVALVPQLVRALDDRNGDVRERAAEALAQIRTDAARAALRKALTHADANVRRIAVEFFGEEGKP